MSKLTARILSKIGLFLVAIGFFMPFAEKMNVFGLLNDLSRAASWLDIDMGSYKLLVYLIFISAVIGVFIGVIILCLLPAKKSINLSFDWCPVLIANGSFLVLLSRLNNLANEAMGFFGSNSSGLKDLISEYLQIGAYFILIGLIVSVVFAIAASFLKSSEIDGITHYPFDIKSHLLDIAILTFTVGVLLLSSSNGNNSLKMVIFSVLILFIIVAGTYERLKNEKI